MSTIDNDELVAKKIKQFALDMKNKNADWMEDLVDSESTSSEEELDNMKTLGTNDNTTAECNANEMKEATAKRH